jgi:hypothetical protein
MNIPTKKTRVKSESSVILAQYQQLVELKDELTLCRDQLQQQYSVFGNRYVTVEFQLEEIEAVVERLAEEIGDDQ